MGSIVAFLQGASRAILSIWLRFEYAVALANFIGIILGYILYSKLVFNQSQKKRQRQIWSFLLMNLLYFPVVYFVSIYLNNYLNFHGITSYSKDISNALAICFPALINFLIYKLYIFK